MRHYLYTDGLGQGNPGQAAIGFVFYTVEHCELFALAYPIGKATHNVAKYRALIAGLTFAARHTQILTVRGDSELIVRQVMGEYQVNHSALIPLWEQAVILCTLFEEIEVEWIARTSNRRAEEIAQWALRTGKSLVWDQGVLLTPE